MNAFFSNPDPRRHARRAAFSLIELLGVVGIIAILLGIVLSAIETVHRYGRKTVAQAEVRALEDAWKRYYDHYHRWPTNATADFVLHDQSRPGEYLTYRIDAAVGNALEGHLRTSDAALDALAHDLNPDGLHFIEFSRHSLVDGRRSPVNPWFRGGPGRVTNASYYVRFDIHANNLTSLEGIARLSAEARAGNANHAKRSVIAWTYNPDAPDEYAIVSWSR